MHRQATVSRKTSETEVVVDICLDHAFSESEKQLIDVSTGIGFLDHVIRLSIIHLSTSHP